MRGAFWSVLYSAAGKVVTLSGQIALAWFLVPKDIGLVSLAISISGFFSILAVSGLREILVQRQDSFTRDSGKAFWFSLGMSMTSGGLVAAISPIAGSICGEPRIAPLMMIIAISWPVQALSTVYSAAVLKDLRFRKSAAIQFGSGLVQVSVAVFLAAKGFGAYSLVLPLPLMGLYTFVAFRMASGPIPLKITKAGGWLPLLSPAVWLMLCGYLLAIQGYGANFAIGVFKDPVQLGIYFFGYLLSSQIVFLLATNLQNVLFPAFAKLNLEEERQYRGFRNAASIMTTVTAPVCAIQVVAASPLLRVFFPPRWYPAATVLEWMSVGMLTQPLNVLGGAVLMARGRYKQIAGVCGIQGALVVLAAGLSAWAGDLRAIAMCTGITLFVTNLIPVWWLVKDQERKYSEIMIIAGRPVLIAVTCGIAGLGGIAVTRGYGDTPELLGAVALVVLVFWAIARCVMPRLGQEIYERIHAALVVAKA